MTDYHFDWTLLPVLLATSSTIPTDITFKVVDKKEQVVAKFEAHKMIVALHSDHFKNFFYGSGVSFKEGEGGMIIIEETTKEAFEDFLGFLYEKKIDFNAKNLEELYEILNLAEMYQVDELKDMLVDVFKNFPVSVETVADVAATAEEFSHFEIHSQALFSGCVTFIGKQTEQSVSQFIRTNEDKLTAMKLLENVKKLKCSNCQQTSCRDSTEVTSAHLLKPGMKIKIPTYGRGMAVYYKYATQALDMPHKLCKVVRIEGHINVFVEFEDPRHSGERWMCLDMAEPKFACKTDPRDRFWIMNPKVFQLAINRA